MKSYTLPSRDIDQLLGRRRRRDHLPDQLPVDEFFAQMLRIADRFVPSEAGSVLIDDPHLKVGNVWSPANNELVFVACYGEQAENLLGKRLRADQGIAGRTYLGGQPSIISDATNAEGMLKLAEVDASFVTRSMISVPIQIGRSCCGVIELINRLDRPSFEERDLELLLIFAGYISTSLQNVLDANRYRELSKRDDLTGLYNDRYFNQSLSEFIERAEGEGSNLSLIFLDLDHFKKINDRHGHLVGSQTLREVGLILAGSVTPDQAVVARYGGDEFVIIVPGADLDDAVALSERIRARIQNAVFRIDHDVEGSGVLIVSGVVTASIGVSSYREFRFSPTTRLVSRKNALIRGADQSMYKAKADGKNRVCFGVYEPGGPVAGLASR